MPNASVDLSGIGGGYGGGYGRSPYAGGFFGGPGAGSGLPVSSDPSVTTGYGKGGGVASRVGRSGIDIGAKPDFWGDLNQIVNRLRPQGRSGAYQAQALRAPAAVQQPSSVFTPSGRGGAPSVAPQSRFATYIGGGPGVVPGAYTPWTGGAYSALNAPVATYSG